MGDHKLTDIMPAIRAPWIKKELRSRPERLLAIGIVAISVGVSSHVLAAPVAAGPQGPPGSVHSVTVAPSYVQQAAPNRPRRSIEPRRAAVPLKSSMARTASATPKPTPTFTPSPVSPPKPTPVDVPSPEPKPTIVTTVTPVPPVHSDTPPSVAPASP